MMILPLVLLVVFLIGCSAKDLPQIDKPDQLVKDCDALLASGAIDRSQWPASIRSLNPVSVDRGENYIMITTKAQTGAEARGYVVSRQDALEIAHYRITASAYPDIYTFELMP